MWGNTINVSRVPLISSLPAYLGLAYYTQSNGIRGKLQLQNKKMLHLPELLRIWAWPSSDARCRILTLTEVSCLHTNVNASGCHNLFSYSDLRNSPPGDLFVLKPFLFKAPLSFSRSFFWPTMPPVAVSFVEIFKIGLAFRTGPTVVCCYSEERILNL